MATNSAQRLSIIEESNFSKSDPNKVRHHIAALLKSGDINIKQIGRFTTYGESTISLWLSGKYETDSERVDEAMARFYRHWLIVNAIIPTKGSEEVYAVLTLAHKRLEIARIKADFGTGKTKAINHYMVDHEEAVLVDVTAPMSPTELLNQIGVALGIRAQMAKGTGSDKLNAILRELARRSKKPLLIFDEADKLRARTLSVLQDIYGKESDGRCAMALFGTEKLDTLLKAPELGYFFSRVTIAREMKKISFDEAQKIIDMWPHDLGVDEMKEMYEFSLAHYSCRTLITLLKRSYDMMQIAKKKEITSSHVELAYDYLLK